MPIFANNDRIASVGILHNLEESLLARLRETADLSGNALVGETALRPQAEAGNTGANQPHDPMALVVYVFETHGPAVIIETTILNDQAGHDLVTVIVM